MALTKVPGSMVSPAQSGSVIQTVNNNLFGNGAYFSTTTAGTYQATGHTLSITPQFSTSKILLTCTGFFGVNGVGAYLTIYRNSTDLSQTSGSYNSCLSGLFRSDGSGSANLFSFETVTFLDSPATTSSTTYQVYIQTQTSGQSAYWGADPAWLNHYNITFTAQEIAQ